MQTGNGYTEWWYLGVQSGCLPSMERKGGMGIPKKKSEERTRKVFFPPPPPLRARVEGRLHTLVSMIARITVSGSTAAAAASPASVTTAGASASVGEEMAAKYCETSIHHMGNERVSRGTAETQKDDGHSAATFNCASCIDET